MADQAYTVAIAEATNLLLSLLANVRNIDTSDFEGAHALGEAVRDSDVASFETFEEYVVEKSLELKVDPFRFVEDTSCMVMQRINQHKRKGETTWKS